MYQIYTIKKIQFSQEFIKKKQCIKINNKKANNTCPRVIIHGFTSNKMFLFFVVKPW